MSYKTYNVNSDEDLNKLKREIQTLKRQKENKVALATSKTERNKLLKEIKDLDDMGKSPSKLKSFSKAVSRGFNSIAKGIQKGSKNMSKSMANQNQPKLRRLPEQPQYNSWDALP